MVVRFFAKTAEVLVQTLNGYKEYRTAFEALKLFQHLEAIMTDKCSLAQLFLIRRSFEMIHESNVKLVKHHYQARMNELERQQWQILGELDTIHKQRLCGLLKIYSKTNVVVKGEKNNNSSSSSNTENTNKKNSNSKKERQRDRKTQSDTPMNYTRHKNTRNIQNTNNIITTTTDSSTNDQIMQDNSSQFEQLLHEGKMFDTLTQIKNFDNSAQSIMFTPINIAKLGKYKADQLSYVPCMDQRQTRQEKNENKNKNKYKNNNDNYGINWINYNKYSNSNINSNSKSIKFKHNSINLSNRNKMDKKNGEPINLMSMKKENINYTEKNKENKNTKNCIGLPCFIPNCKENENFDDLNEWMKHLSSHVPISNEQRFSEE